MCVTLWNSNSSPLQDVSNTFVHHERHLLGKHAFAFLIHSASIKGHASRVLEGIECFVRVANERQAHFRILFRQDLLGMCPVHGGIVLLWDFIDREVAHIDVGRQFGFEWCTNFSQLVPNNSTEEGMLFDGRCSVMSSAFLTQAILCIT